MSIQILLVSGMFGKPGVEPLQRPFGEREWRVGRILDSSPCPALPLSSKLDASEEIEQSLGASPGLEFLMSLAVEHEECGEIIDTLHQPAAAHQIYDSEMIRLGH
jgi:hypothetical protein